MNKNLLALTAGVLVGILVSNTILSTRQNDGHFHSHDSEEGAYHVHADFSFIINDKKIDLSDKKYMSVTERLLHTGVHLHDENGDVIHFHERNITLVEFLNSLGFDLDEECISLNESSYCTEKTNSLKLYVNAEDKTSSLTTYVPQDEDRILLYFGTASNEAIDEYLGAIKDDACLYSGTCPERGTAPPESCGLTCEL